MYSCFHSVGLPDLAIGAVIDRVADAGYAALELNAETLPWAPAHVTPETPAEERRAIVAACKRRGLKVTLKVGTKKGDGLMRRLDVSRGPEVMLQAALQEAAKAAGVELQINENEVLIAP